MNYKLAETLLKLENISLKFGDKLVLRDINLEIKDIIGDVCTGQIVTLLGRSGVGKSTLFRVIAGLIKPTTGSVLIGEQQMPTTPGMVGMVLQNYPLFAHRTLLANLQLVCRDKGKIESYMNDFDIYDRRKAFPAQLSGGQRQRAAIVQQLLCSEHFILFDEPFSGLDPVATEKLCRTIVKVANQDEKNTVIISSHILEPALAVSDSVMMMGYQTIQQTWETGSNIEPPDWKPIDQPDQKPMTNGDQKAPGATICYNYDLAANGLAWNPEIRKDLRFTALVEEIRNIFQTL